MKKLFKHYSKLALVAMLAVIMFALTGCTAVQFSASSNFNEDGTGSRTITASIAKNDNNNDGYGSAYYYLTKHGDKLADYIQSTYADKVSGSEDWLTVSADNSGADWEVIDLTFDFTSFEDYKAKLAALAYDGTAAATYVAPELTDNGDGTATYTENAAALTAIFKSIQTTVMADNSVFDFNSTKDGTALNNGTADLQSLKDFGVELMKPEFGDQLKVSFGGDATVVAAADGVFKITGEYAAMPVAEDTSDTEDETTTTETDIPKTGENTGLAIVSLICLTGFAVAFVATKKRNTQNQ